MFLPAQPPFVLRWAVPFLHWQVRTTDPVVYLTFDDGPCPGVTEPILDTLRQHGATATHFLVGNNVQQHPALVQRMLAEGHTLGNHTYTHRSGWKCTEAEYLAEIRRTDEAIQAATGQPTTQMRPPYGRIHPLHISAVRQTHQIVMYSGLAYDWDATYSPAQCLALLEKALRPGAILVLHDSLKAKDRVLHVLPQLLRLCRERGYAVRALPKQL